MRKINFLGAIVFAMAMCLIVSGPTQAATDETPTTTSPTTTTAAESKDIPSSWGFFWRDIQERISLALTLNPVKKADKQVTFAEERLKLAE